ncbi:MAG: hypothetical protein KC910_00110, partial [Candidatus Eremiobacteraeota bacterium]|nr:hypothetical protein [Candidatus Eremiobacteraeota bacterium]
MPLRSLFILTLAALCCGSARAESLNYHVEKIALEARGLQLALAADESSTWGRQTASDDLRRLQSTAEAFSQSLEADPKPSFEEATQFLVQLEVAAARVRTSREIAGYEAEQQLAVDRMLMEAKEARRNLTAQREAAERQQASRSTPRFSLGLSFGRPWGWGYPYYYPRYRYYPSYG